MTAQEGEQLLVKENTIKADPDGHSSRINNVTLTERPHYDIEIKVSMTHVKQELDEPDEDIKQGGIDETSANLDIKHEEVEIKDEWSNAQSCSMAEGDDSYVEGSLKCKEENSDYSQQSQTTTSTEVDTQRKRFICILCGYKAVKHSGLICHMRVHTGEKPFTCNLCDFKTAQKGNLSDHMKIHTGEKPFTCNLCNFKAAQKSSLTKHRKIHTGEKPFTCNLCDYKTSHKGSLRKHMKIHTGEKPFTCHLCNFKTAEKGNLSKHMNIHTGEKSFACNLCDYKTALKGSLSRHMKIHAGE